MMKDKISLGIFQIDSVWEDVKSNQKQIESLLNELENLPGILILPEMYATGFTMNPENINKEDIASQLNWQQSMSNKYNISLMGSTIFIKNSKYRNRLIYTSYDSSPVFYDKRHLFQMEKENFSSEFRTERPIIDFHGVKIMPQICYDIRFPVWSRNDSGYHLLVYVANWPASRRIVWDTLLRARAIENQCYCVGVNRVGIDGNSIKYDGGSAIFGPKGEEIMQMNSTEKYLEVELSVNELIEFREKFGAYKDADKFEIKNRELPPPGHLYS
jgi:omega-amidase